MSPPVTLLLALALFAVTPAAIAQPAAPPRGASKPDPVALAKSHFAKGTEHFQHGRYAEAAAAFGAGYELSHKPGFLWNMAECARLSSDPELAATLYRRYLTEAPDGPKRAEAEAWLRVSTPKPEPAEPTTAPMPALTPASRSETTDWRPGDASAPSKHEKRPAWPAIVFGSGGALALSGGVALEIVGALTAADLAKRTCQGGADSCGTDLVAATDRRNGFVAGGAAALGLGALSLGAMIGYLAWPAHASKPAPIAFIPSVSPERGEALVVGTW